MTGAGGFVGSRLVPALSAAGYEVIGTDVFAPDWAPDGWVAGDIADPDIRKRALAGCEAAIHLATVPGGAAEQAPTLAHGINVEAATLLSQELASASPGARFVFASSVAVLGDPLPPHVNDTTKLAPVMLYGAHKAMMETWFATLHRRGDLQALSLRLPGIVARPEGPSGMKSAFMSTVFHALARRLPVELPVSPGATMWLMSVSRASASFVHALDVAAAGAAERSLTLPALHVRMADLVSEICRRTGADPSLVSYRPDAATERGFGAQPPLSTPAAEALGFRHDGTLAQLVSSALASIESNGKAHL